MHGHTHTDLLKLQTKQEAAAPLWSLNSARTRGTNLDRTGDAPIAHRGLKLGLAWAVLRCLLRHRKTQQQTSDPRALGRRKADE